MAVAMAGDRDKPRGERSPRRFTIVIMAGVLQIMLGVLRIGRFVAYTPYSVISGFMSGIGVIIILIQTLPFLGAATATGGPMGAVRAWPDALTEREPERGRHRRDDACGRHPVARPGSGGTCRPRWPR